jgi:hypothetical protein
VLLVIQISGRKLAAETGIRDFSQFLQEHVRIAPLISSAGHLLHAVSLFFDIEDGGDIFLRNVD